ncbi:hypothetical protein BDV10DRAFT_10535 [Aspergillus recurvatus]
MIGLPVPNVRETHILRPLPILLLWLYCFGRSVEQFTIVAKFLGQMTSLLVSLVISTPALKNISAQTLGHHTRRRLPGLRQMKRNGDFSGTCNSPHKTAHRDYLVVDFCSNENNSNSGMEFTDGSHEVCHRRAISAIDHSQQQQH